MTIFIDTQASIDALKKVGFKADQARAVIDTILPLTRAENLTTKDDLVSLEERINTRIDSLRNELKYFVLQVVLAQFVALVGVMLALVKF